MSKEEKTNSTESGKILTLFLSLFILGWGGGEEDREGQRERKERELQTGSALSSQAQSVVRHRA